MKNVIKVNVRLWGDIIGAMTWDNASQVASFQFTQAYYAKPYNIQPTKPIKPLIPFNGIPGDKYSGLPPFIADSLPDTWGSLVFDRWARENGIQPKDCNPLLKLSYIGKRGLGAFEFEPDRNPGEDNFTTLESLERIARRTFKERLDMVISKDDKNDFNALTQLGSQPGGAHSKILIAISDDEDKIMSGQVDTLDGYTQHILKFKEDYSVPTSEIEYAYYIMAQETGIKMMPSRLIEINGQKHFLTQRFDRKDGQKLLTQTMAALIPNATDYENLFFLCSTLKLTDKEKSELFRRMCFNIASGNTDDHNKNFSFIMYPDGHWELAPAYDVTFTSNTWQNPNNGVHSLGVSGKRRFFSKEDLLRFGDDFEIAGYKQILDEVCNAVAQFPKIAERCEVPSDWINNISNILYSIFSE